MAEGTAVELKKVFEHPRLAPNAYRLFWAMVIFGLLARLYVAFSTRGNPFDITSFELARDALHNAPLSLYGDLNEPNAPHWPYPAGFLVWVLMAGWANDLSGLRFDGFIQVAPIVADVAIAWVVQAMLGQQGASDRLRLIATGLVALAPSFAVMSGYHGQIDAVCILPALVGYWIWIRYDSQRRALVVGALIGAGIAIKQPSALVLLALVPSVRGRRELVQLFGTAALVPLVLLLPFLVAHPAETINGLTANRGLPGIGGISLLVQPDLSALWLRTKEVGLSPASQWLFDHGTMLAVGALLVVTILMYRRSTAPRQAVVVIWLTFFVFGINFGITYLILGMPFFLVNGRIREVAALQAGVLVPIVLLYVNRGRDLPLEAIYTPVMLVVWVGLLAWWVSEMRTTLRASESQLPSRSAVA